MLLVSVFAPMPAGPGKLGPGMLVFFPFLYALAGLKFVPLACWIYNLAAGIVGGCAPAALIGRLYPAAQLHR
jgi:hypothetical protein